MSTALNFAFRKFELDDQYMTIYEARLNESPFKYFISILGGGSEAMLILLIYGKFQNIHEILAKILPQK